MLPLNRAQAVCPGLEEEQQCWEAPERDMTPGPINRKVRGIKKHRLTHRLQLIYSIIYSVGFIQQIYHLLQNCVHDSR